MKKYNEDIKNRFMEYIDLSKYPPKWWDYVFDKSSVFEEMYGRDLYDFSTSNIIEFLKYLELGNINSLVVYKINLGKYAEWAVSQNLVADNQIHFNEITMELLNSCISRARIDNAILSYDTIRNIHFVNSRDAFIFWSLFEGIKGKDFEEIINLKIEDFDEATQTVRLCTGRVIPVSDRFIYICKAANVEKTYIGLNDKGYVVNLKPSEYIYKERDNSRGINKARGVYKTIIRNMEYLKDLNKGITAKSIRDSGLIYYLNKRADEYGITVNELLHDLPKCQDIIDKYNFNILTRVRWMMMYEDYLH